MDNDPEQKCPLIGKMECLNTAPTPETKATSAANHSGNIALLNKFNKTSSKECVRTLHRSLKFLLYC